MHSNPGSFLGGARRVDWWHNFATVTAEIRLPVATTD